MTESCAHRAASRHGLLVSLYYAASMPWAVPLSAGNDATAAMRTVRLFTLLRAALRFASLCGACCREGAIRSCRVVIRVSNESTCEL